MSAFNFEVRVYRLMKKALVMVDLQKDFCAGGQLAVPAGDEVIPIANKLQDHFDLIIATQDWHPADHISFASQHPGRQIGDVIKVGDIDQVLWPAHCIQNSDGAAFHPDLKLDRIQHIVHKGTDKRIDSYSAFFDNAHLRSTGLQLYLRELGIDTIYLLGLATDYCVKYSALDAIHLGLTVYLIKDACRGVELHHGDIQSALDEMEAVGVKLTTSDEVFKAN